MNGSFPARTTPATAREAVRPRDPLDDLADALVDRIVEDPERCERLAVVIAGRDSRPPGATRAYTVASLARELGVTDRWIRRQIAEGRLRAERRGTRYVIGAGAVADFASSASPSERRVPDRASRPMSRALAHLEGASSQPVGPAE